MYEEKTIQCNYWLWETFWWYVWLIENYDWLNHGKYLIWFLRVIFVKISFELFEKLCKEKNKTFLKIRWRFAFSKLWLRRIGCVSFDMFFYWSKNAHTNADSYSTKLIQHVCSLFINCSSLGYNQLVFKTRFDRFTNHSLW